jgi:hypothetical protein
MVFILSVFALKVLQNFPNSADEYVYLFEAKTFASGHISVAPPPMPEVFGFFYIIQRGDRYFGIFPFGYPFLLSLGVIIGVPWVINPLLGALTILLIYLIARHVFSRRVALISSILGFFTPFFILNSASYFSHTACTFFLALIIYSYQKSQGTNRLFWYFMIGASSGFAFITRYVESVVTVIPIGIILAIKFLRNPKKMLKPCLAVFLGGVIFLATFMTYNSILIGDPFTPPSKYFNPREGISFSMDYLKEGLDYFSTFFPELFSWTYYLPLAIFPPFFFFSRSKPPFLTLILIVISILHILSYLFCLMGAGNQYGPRYYYGFYFALPILASYAIERLLRRKEFIYPIVAIILVLNIQSIIKKSYFYYDLIYLRQDLFRTVQDAGLDKAIVFLGTPSFDMTPRELTRNGLELDGSILYAHDISLTKQKQLLKYFPGYRPYSYEFDLKRQKGLIRPIFTESIPPVNCQR